MMSFYMKNQYSFIVEEALDSWIFDVHRHRTTPGFTIICSIFFFLIPFASSLSFDYTSFTPNDPNITYENSSFPADNVIYLTRNQQDRSSLASVGRATYSGSLYLWDRTSRNLTDFTSNFSFVTNSLNQSSYGDGLAFFLAPFGAKVPNNTTKGGSMGLTSDFDPLNSTDNPFVAVEFDIFPNYWDPPTEHVGININSMRSAANVTWWSRTSIMAGLKNDVWISYDSVSTNLSLVFTGFLNGSSIRQRLSYIVYLREHLPEFVTFGFSAATGNASALHSILSWSFSSNLEVRGNATATNGTGAGVVETGSNSRKNKTGVVIGVVFGVLTFVGGFSLLIFFLWKKRRAMSEDDDMFDGSIGDDFEQGNGPKKFSYTELSRATNKFCMQEKLGERDLAEFTRDS